MKKISQLMILAIGATGSSGLFAGNMGPEPFSPLYRPFIAGEGLYSWPKIQGLSITLPAPEANTGVADVINKGWGGRVAAGLMHSMSDRFAYSGEIGWGYYGHTSMPIKYASPLSANAIAAGIGETTGNLDQWGFDVLAGLLYTQPRYDLYFKAGALFEDLRIGLSHIVMNTSGGSMTLNAIMAGALPEIKLGAAYHVTDHWAANVSWMYAFGGTFDVSIPYYNNNSVATLGALKTELKNPSMNVLMFGLEYRFA